MRYMILKIILLTIQAICLLIWGLSIIFGIQWLPEIKKRKKGYRFCIWWMAIFIVMITIFRFMLDYTIHFSIFSVIIGSVSILFGLYILWGVLFTTGIAHSSEWERFPLIRLYMIYFFLLVILKYVA